MVEWADSFVYYMKNSGEGGKIFRLLDEKPQVGWKYFQETINGHALLHSIRFSYLAVS